MLSYREAVSILMLSPAYWFLTVTQRWQLVKEYCASYEVCAVE